ncbi:DDE-type integrase/transposase/recombinase [Candidatus Saccharibacteria bacterium]|nr:MAG: DDE-type integrase/transposase/recombinase [Candidatus Saccharibacteria bacterium]
MTRPGELVETDTIHYICPLTKSRRYVYTVIDLYTRMAYVEIHPRILPGLAARVVLHARNEFGFDFHMVQADNGPSLAITLSKCSEEMLCLPDIPDWGDLMTMHT